VVVWGRPRRPPSVRADISPPGKLSVEMVDISLVQISASEALVLQPQ